MPQTDFSTRHSPRTIELRPSFQALPLPEIVQDSLEEEVCELDRFRSIRRILKYTFRIYYLLRIEISGWRVWVTSVLSPWDTLLHTIVMYSVIRGTPSEASMSIYEAWLREEIDFWLRFIEEWEQQHRRSAPIRMRAALELAEEKLQQYLENPNKLNGTNNRMDKSGISIH